MIEVATIMFWVGVLVIIAGGSQFFPSNHYQGQGETSMFSLRFNKDSDFQGEINKKEEEIISRIFKGTIIALSGITLIIIAVLLLMR